MNYDSDKPYNKVVTGTNNILLAESDAYSRMGIVATEPSKEVAVKKTIEEQNPRQTKLNK